MVKRAYADWTHYGSEEPCPAIYIKLTRPQDNEPVVEDLIAAVDSGSSITAIPAKYKGQLQLYPSGYTRVRFRGYFMDKEPTYQVYVTANACKPRLVEVIYDPEHDEYALLGRNLMKYWNTEMRGPEYILEITEPD